MFLLIEIVVNRAIANAEPGQDNVDKKNVSAQVRTNFKDLIKLGYINILKPPEQDLEETPDNTGVSHPPEGVATRSLNEDSVVPSVAAGVTSSIPILWKVNLIKLQRCLLNQVRLHHENRL